MEQANTPQSLPQLARQYCLGIKVLVNTAFQPMYLLYAFLWVCTIEGAVTLTLGEAAWLPDSNTLLRSITLYFMLFYLTLIDEIKDFEYDSIYNPDRVLVSGALSLRQVVVTAVIIAATLLLINTSIFPFATVMLLVDLFYGLLLLVIERRSERFKNNIIVNLIFTYPVQLMLSIYILISLLEQYQLLSNVTTLQVTWLIWLWPVIKMCVFMHYEFGRKIAWNDDNPNFYSNVLGPKASALIACCFGLVGVTLLAYMLAFGISLELTFERFAEQLIDNSTRIWLSGAVLFGQILLLIAGIWRFFNNRNKAYPQSFVVAFFFLFLISTPIQVLLF